MSPVRINLPTAMSINNLSPGNLPTATLGGVDAALRTAQPGGTRLDAISGNDLLGLDAWGSTRATERTLSLPGTASPGHVHSIDQIVDHILAPLG